VDNCPIYGKQKFHEAYDSTERYPRSVLIFPSDKQKENLHPTQKPVALCEYLIRTYTDEGEVVLDNCMGSGTTGIACLNTKRKFIGIEKDPLYFAAAKERIESHDTTSSPMGNNRIGMVATLLTTPAV
jgi:DNA modification methylase